MAPYMLRRSDSEPQAVWSRNYGDEIHRQRGAALGILRIGLGKGVFCWMMFVQMAADGGGKTAIPFLAWHPSASECPQPLK